MVQMTSDIALSGVACTSGVTPRQLVQSSSENDNYGREGRRLLRRRHLP
ncbi:NTP-binding protein [Pseudomonas aeruginosa]|nr:NTP-binding protein [Pseudomonas aeruginosa]